MCARLAPLFHCLSHYLASGTENILTFSHLLTAAIGVRSGGMPASRLSLTHLNFLSIRGGNPV